MSKRAELGVGTHEQIVAIFRNPALYEAGAALDDTGGGYERDRRGGRPRQYPTWFLIGVGECADHFASARRFFTELDKDPYLWPDIRRIAGEGDHDLPLEPPSRTWYVKAKRRLDWADTERIATVATESALQTAKDIGLLDSSASRNTVHPREECTVVCDGKVIRPPSDYTPGDFRERRRVDPETGEVTTERVPVKNVDPDARKHGVGGRKDPVRGSKYWLSSVRTRDHHGRVILQAAYVPDEKGKQNSEGDIFVGCIEALARRAPGMQAVIADGVVRDQHRSRLIRNTGLKVISPPIAESVDKKTGSREEKARHLRTETFTAPDGSDFDVAIHAVGGRICQVAYTDEGEPKYVPLERVDASTIENRNGTYRDYVVYELPDPFGGQARRIRERTWTNEADEAKGFRRGEYLHQIPRGDPDYTRLYGRRSDSESINRGIEDHLQAGRARSYGAVGQYFDLLCHQLRVNSLTLARHRARSAVHDAA